MPNITYTPYCLNFWLYNNSAVPGNDSAIGGPSTYQTLISFGGSTAGINLGGWTGGATNEAIHIWSTSGGTKFTYTQTVVPIGWHNWCFNWNGTTYDIWVDGIKQSVLHSGGGAALITYTNSNLYIGSDSANYKFYGKIYNFSMYESIITDNQVVSNFNKMRKRFGI